MKVHVFGNSPSPAVAIYGLRLSVQEGEKDYGKEVKKFVERDFYVDDGLKSLPLPEAAISLLKISLLKRTQSMLSCSNLRLHKIASNSKVVMEAFPSQDHASDLKNLDLATDPLPMQRSLGLSWDLKSDTFSFQVDEEQKPFTRHGVLTTINSLYDPLGFAAPVIIQGHFLLFNESGAAVLSLRLTGHRAQLPISMWLPSAFCSFCIRDPPLISDLLLHVCSGWEPRLVCHL